MNRIQIYGPGCATCASLAEVTKEAVKELQWDVSVEKVTDPVLFAGAGVMVTPALVVDGRVLVAGKVPSVEAVKDLLREADAPSLPDSCCSGRKEQAESACKGGSGGCCGKREGGDSGSACCGDGGCCGGRQGSAGWKKAVVWVVLILVVLAVVKLVNRGNKAASPPSSPSAVPVMQDQASSK